MNCSTGCRMVMAGSLLGAEASLVTNLTSMIGFDDVRDARPSIVRLALLPDKAIVNCKHETLDIEINNYETHQQYLQQSIILLPVLL